MNNSEVGLVGMAAALCIVWAGAALAEQNSQTAVELTRAASLANRGVALFQNGSYVESERLLREALAIRERLLPGSDGQLAATINDLGASLHYQARYKDAEALYLRALLIFGDRPEYLSDCASTLANLASVYRELREFDKAGETYSKLFEVFKATDTISESTIATVYSDYGMLLRAKGDWTGAERAFERAVGIRERKPDPALISVRTSLADLYYARRDYDRAENLFRQAVETCERMLGGNSRHCGSPLNGLALSLVRRGLEDEPEQLFRRALAIFEQTYGPNHPRVAAVLNNLGTLAQHKHDYKHATEYLSRALAIWTSVFGPEHPDVAAASANLATVYMRKHQWALSESLYRRALATDEKLFGTEHEKVAVDLNNLGVLYSTMKHYDEAEAALTRAIAVYERASGPNSTTVAGVVLNLANQYVTAKRYAEAIPLFQRALDIYERSPGDESAIAPAAFENYAKLLRKSDDYAAAQKAEAFAMRIRVRSTIARDRAQSSFAAQP